MKTSKFLMAIIALVILSTLHFCAISQQIYKVDTTKSDINGYIQKQIDNAGEAKVAVMALALSGNASVYIPDSIVVNDKNMIAYFHSANESFDHKFPIIRKGNDFILVTSAEEDKNENIKVSFYNERGSRYMKFDGNKYLVYKQK